ncbi:MAG: VanZ family protein [Butyricicoccus sp.]
MIGFVGAMLEELAIEVGSAAVFVVPVLLLIWLLRRRYGGIRRLVLVLLFALYLCAVLTVVGFPSVGHLQWDPNVQPVPMKGVAGNLREFGMNVLLFVPLGFFVPLLWRRGRSLGGILLTGFLFSALIEGAQLFCLRATDVNDLIANTAGAVIGWLISRIIWMRMPVRNVCGWMEPVAAAAGSVLVMMVFQPTLANVLWMWNM